MQVFVPGRKVEGFQVVFEKYGSLIDGYEQVALLDDDIRCDAQALSRCFDIGSSRQLSIWQPSLSCDSYFTYAGTLHNPHYKVRFVNFIEMMCPFFSRSALKSVEILFSYGWESGIDLVWCSVLPPRKQQFAIVDAVQVRHTRPVGTLKEANGFQGRNYEDDIYACLDHFNMDWPSLVVEAAIGGRGGEVTGAAITLGCLPLLRAALTTPTPGALRLASDHVRHQLCRKAIFGQTVAEVLAADGSIR